MGLYCDIKINLTEKTERVLCILQIYVAPFCLSSLLSNFSPITQSNTIFLFFVKIVEDADIFFEWSLLQLLPEKIMNEHPHPGSQVIHGLWV